jgi:hypothetical protein
VGCAGALGRGRPRRLGARVWWAERAWWAGRERTGVDRLEGEGLGPQGKEGLGFFYFFPISLSFVLFFLLVFLFEFKYSVLIKYSNIFNEFECMHKHNNST